ncbi:uncharacterized protein LOC142325718 [Lycorma delicatula]|uniref:uncharacterized protein LOC142325718 n=1 Tax=Lycorma delicatula TaxID=130591 RepID=UPI003F5108BF
MATVPPIDLLVMERWLRFHDMGKQEATEVIQQKWQERWNRRTVASWSRKTVPDISQWINRRHGEMGFYTSQIMTGHGNFEQYLHRFGRRVFSRCMYCEEEDTAEHTLLICPKWRVQRSRNSTQDLTIDDLLPFLLANADDWQKFETFASQVLREKDNEGRSRGF